MRLAEAGRGAVAVAAVPLAAAGIGRGWQVLAQLRSPAWGLSHFHFLWLSGPGRQALGVLWAAGRPRGRQCHTGSEYSSTSTEMSYLSLAEYVLNAAPDRPASDCPGPHLFHFCLTVWWRPYRCT